MKNFYPIFNFVFAMYPILEILASIFCTFFPINMEGSKRTSTHIGYLPSSIKSKQQQQQKQKKQKKIQPYDGKFLIKQYIKLF